MTIFINNFLFFLSLLAEMKKVPIESLINKIKHS